MNEAVSPRRPRSQPAASSRAPDPREWPAEPADLVDYYGRRAPEYDDIYRRRQPERQAEQRLLAAAMRSALAGRRVLEVACGTGWWTAKLAPAAAAITAVDASAAMLERARRRRYPPRRVEFVAGDAHDLEAVPGRFDGGLAAFWVSHVPRAKLAGFLDRFHARLDPGAAVVLADGVPVPGIGGAPAPGPPGSGDAYKLRRLADGSRYRVLKNYFSEAELAGLLAPRSDGLVLHFGPSIWWAIYRTRGAAAPRGAQ